MVPLRTLLRADRSRILRRPMTWVLGIVVGGLTGLIYFSLALALLAPDLQGELSEQEVNDIRELVILPEGFGFGLSAVTGFGTITLIILAAGIFGSEFSWGTARTSLMAGVSRDRFYASKVVVLLAVGAALTVGAAALGFGGSLATGILVDRSLYADEWLNLSFIGDGLLMMLRAYIGIALWIMIASTVTLVTRSLAAGVGVTLGLNIGGDIVLSLIATTGDIGRWIARLFPNRAVNALASMNSANPPSYEWTDYAWITANLAFYTAATILVAIIVFRRMDIIAASD